jgi:hypothetical protein
VPVLVHLPFGHCRSILSCRLALSCPILSYPILSSLALSLSALPSYVCRPSISYRFFVTDFIVTFLPLLYLSSLSLTIPFSLCAESAQNQT